MGRHHAVQPNWLVKPTPTSSACGCPPCFALRRGLPRALDVMAPISWLEARIPGFRQLPAVDRAAISNFSLLWSLFEAKALDRNASARRILALTHEWAASQALDAERFDAVLQYFRDRYFPGGQQSHHFQHLHLRGNDNPALVEAVLRGQNNNPADCVGSLLIVVYRFRNNLFHGAKWGYELQGQLQNFTMANDTLMNAIECNDA